MTKRVEFPLSPYSYIQIVNGLIYAENVLFSTILRLFEDKDLFERKLTQEIIYDESQSYRSTGVTTYTSKSDANNYLILEDKGLIIKCCGLNFGSLFSRMDNWVYNKELRHPYCKDVQELLTACIQLLEGGEVPYPGMTIYLNNDEFVVKIPLFREEDSPLIQEVSLILRRWLQKVANRPVFLVHHKVTKELTFLYTLD